MNDALISKKDVEILIFQAITAKITSKLEGYSSPLEKIVNDVVLENEPKIRAVVTEALNTVFSDDKFSGLVKEEFQRKVAKNLVGKLEGAVEKSADKLRQDESVKARMILAIEAIVNSQPNDPNY